MRWNNHAEYSAAVWETSLWLPQSLPFKSRPRQRQSRLIPYADRAVIDIRKLRDYCLNPAHDEGRHKARVFAAALGLTLIDAEALRAILLDIVLTHEAQLDDRDAYGQRYIVDFWLDWHGKQAQGRSGWLLEHGSMTPRLTSCKVL